MTLDTIISRLFENDQKIIKEGDIVFGEGKIQGQSIAVAGTLNEAAIGVELALKLADFILRVVQTDSKMPILLLIDTSGQRLSRRDELLGINGYLAHLSKSIELAKSHGHLVFSLVYGLGVSGGYLSNGMLADRCFALGEAEIKVMSLAAMSRITKIPLEKLNDLSQTSPVFAPGAANYEKMGFLKVVDLDQLVDHLKDGLMKPVNEKRKNQDNDAVKSDGEKLSFEISETIRRFSHS